MRRANVDFMKPPASFDRSILGRVVLALVFVLGAIPLGIFILDEINTAFHGRKVEARDFNPRCN